MEDNIMVSIGRKLTEKEALEIKSEVSIVS